MKNYKYSSLLKIVSITIIVIFAIIYFVQPVLAKNFPITLLGSVVVLFAATFIILTIQKCSLEVKFFSSLIFSVIVTAIIFVVSTTSIFHSESYRNLLGSPKVSDFTAEISPVDVDQIRIVDQSMAYKLAEKKLGEEPGLGSRAELGTINIQSVNGKLYWVAPILHSGFFKWWTFDSTPGYVKVSASNPRDVELVKKVGGKDIQIKYQPNAFFGQSLSRHIYFSGYMTVGLTDYSFEIDDSGKPYYVVTTYDYKIGLRGADATGVLVVDPQTGEITPYPINDAPAWVDRIQPESFVASQVSDWGKYVKGWWNSFTSKEEMLTPTKGMSLVYSNGESYWYTGISSVGRDESTVGFMLINTRTKQSHWYQQSGATELAAKQSAEGKVQEKGYVASFPVLYNIGGVPTYVMSLKDNAGLIKMVAMVSVEDYTIVGVGNTIRTSLRAYKSALVNKGNSLVPGTDSDMKTTTAKITRFAVDVRGGESFYAFTLEKISSIFTGTSAVSAELPISKVGDKVEVQHLDSDSKVIDISRFDNLEIQ